MAISPEIKDQIVKLYAQNISISRIHKIVGVSGQTISKILKSAGIVIRRKNYRELGLDEEEINKLYDSGLSTYEIAEKLDCSDETIRKLIRNMRSIKNRNRLDQRSIQKIAVSSKRNWENAEYRNKVEAGKTPEYYERLREVGHNNYANSLGAWINSESAKEQISLAVKKMWEDPTYRAKQAVWFQERGDRLTKASLMALADPEKRKEWIKKLRQANANKQNNGWISTSQAQLYYILSDSMIEYFEEGLDTRVGPFYVVDCIIPQQQQMTKPLIIEVNGEYWHSLPHVTLKDKQKATYITRYTDYDLLILEELEMKNFSQVEGKLQSFGLILKSHQCDVHDIAIQRITEEEAQIFYSIFHYASSVRKGATTFGAFFGDILIAAISYTYPLRTQSATRLGCERDEVMEISRLARKTNVECKNLMSYFIAKTKKLLPPKIKKIISFADSTFGHSGGVYKASGFTQDGEIPADYVYLSAYGRYHKKTVWDMAKRMKMSERDYAEKHNLVKIITEPKSRWVLRL